MVSLKNFCRNDLDKSVRSKIQREAKERQEELALDMKILEQLLEESRNEADENLQKRLQRKDEVQKYRSFLQEQVRIFSNMLQFVAP